MVEARQSEAASKSNKNKVFSHKYLEIRYENNNFRPSKTNDCRRDGWFDIETNSKLVSHQSRHLLSWSLRRQSLGCCLLRPTNTKIHHTEKI